MVACPRNIKTSLPEPFTLHMPINRFLTAHTNSSIFKLGYLTAYSLLSYSLSKNSIRRSAMRDCDYRWTTSTKRTIPESATIGAFTQCHQRHTVYILAKRSLARQLLTTRTKEMDEFARSISGHKRSSRPLGATLGDRTA